MDLPPDVELGVSSKGVVCKLKKSLYRLKQSPRAWFGRFYVAMKILAINKVVIDAPDASLQPSINDTQIPLNQVKQLVPDVIAIKSNIQSITEPVVTPELDMDPSYIHNSAVPQLSLVNSLLQKSIRPLSLLMDLQGPLIWI